MWAEWSGEAWGVVSVRSDIGCCRFQSEPTKCLEYARDHDKAGLSEPLTSEAETEDAAKRKHSVTFAEAECKVREFVPDKELVMIKNFIVGILKVVQT